MIDARADRPRGSARRGIGRHGNVTSADNHAQRRRRTGDRGLPPAAAEAAVTSRPRRHLPGLVEVSTLPSWSTAAQKVVVGQLTELIDLPGSTALSVHAAKPPVGSVEVATLPALSTATHSETDGQATLTGRARRRRAGDDRRAGASTKRAASPSRAGDRDQSRASPDRRLRAGRTHKSDRNTGSDDRDPKLAHTATLTHPRCRHIRGTAASCVRCNSPFPIR